MAIPERVPSLKRCVLPCTLMRAGTSKALFIHRKNLPPNHTEWKRHLVSALGSRGNDPRQIDGVGGGASTTSKVAVVARSNRPDADVDWTFVQVSVGKESVDMTGTCGNVSSGVGPFALQSNIVKRRPGQKRMNIRIYNTNTDSVIVETVQLDEAGDFLELGDYVMPGVPCSGSEVKCMFQKPAGSMTGKLFPSEQRQQTLLVEPSRSTMGMVAPFGVRVTLIDAANPFVFIDASSIPFLESLPKGDANTIIEMIRREGAVAMGLAPNVQVAAATSGTPKVALLYPPAISQDGNTQADIRVQSYSMGLPHPSFQLTGAVCLATALHCPGTIAADLYAQASAQRHLHLHPSSEATPIYENRKGSSMDMEMKYRIAHSKGSIDVGIVAGVDGDVQGCVVSRTARKLFEGNVSYYV